MQEYDIFKFIYSDKKSTFKFAIYARDEETANKLISIVNDHNIFHFVKPHFKKFKIAMKVGTPPYELEQSQLESIENDRKHRLEYFEKHGGFDDLFKD